MLNIRFFQKLPIETIYRNFYQQASFEAQGKLLGNANRKIFELETKIKETAHKVERLGDYEKQIEQLTQMQKIW